MNPPTSPRYAVALMLAAGVVVFGAMIAAVTLSLRDDLFQAQLQREADALGALTELLVRQVQEDHVALAPPEESEAIAVEVGLLAASVRGVALVTGHDQHGRFLFGAPDEALPLPITAAEMSLPNGTAAFHRSLPLSSILNTNNLDERADLVEAIIPMGERTGETRWLRFWQDGDPMARVRHEINARLGWVAGGAWGLGSAVLLTLALTFKHLMERRQRLLEARTRELLEANRERDLQSKTTAVGALATCLVHDLRGPLAALQMAIGGLETSRDDGAGSPRAAAQRAARAMQEIISEVVALIRDQQHVSPLPYDWPELVEGLSAAFQGDRRLIFSGSLPGVFSGQAGGLISLCLKQLIANALRASQYNQVVRVGCMIQDNRARIAVSDCAGGLPPHLREHLFQPSEAASANGLGLGLMLARQLARSCGGNLQLDRSDEQGTVFILEVPFLPHCQPAQTATEPVAAPDTATPLIPIGNQ